MLWNNPLLQAGYRGTRNLQHFIFLMHGLAAWTLTCCWCLPTVPRARCFGAFPRSKQLECGFSLMVGAAMLYGCPQPAPLKTLSIFVASALSHRRRVTISDSPFILFFFFLGGVITLQEQQLLTQLLFQ